MTTNASTNQIRTIGTNRQKTIMLPFIGIFCVVMCEICTSSNAVIAKSVSSVDPIQLGASRAFVQFLILLPVLQFQCKTVDITGPDGKKSMLWLRAFFGSFTLVFLYLAIENLPVGNAISLTFMNTIIVPVLARIFLKESLTLLDGVFAISALVGVVLIAEPTFLFGDQGKEQKKQSPHGILYGLICALSMSLSMITVRKLGKETNFLLNVLYFSIAGSITTTCLLAATDKFRFPCFSELPHMFALGIVGLFEQIFLTLALQWERAGTVSALGTLQIIFVYAMQVVILKDIPSTLSIIGAGLIFASSLGIALRKIFNERKRTNQR